MKEKKKKNIIFLYFKICLFFVGGGGGNKIYELHGTHYNKITYFRFNKFLFPKSRFLCDKVEKYVTARQTKGAYIIECRRFLSQINAGKIHALLIFNT